MYIQRKLFVSEVKHGFEITEKQKRVWAIELEMADRLLTVCRENNLRIFADAGTMLGAVRHKGFIPWDDDMDLAMFRRTMISCARLHPDILQNHIFSRMYIQIRNMFMVMHR